MTSEAVSPDNQAFSSTLRGKHSEVSLPMSTRREQSDSMLKKKKKNYARCALQRRWEKGRGGGSDNKGRKTYGRERGELDDGITKLKIHTYGALIPNKSSTIITTAISDHNSLFQI